MVVPPRLSFFSSLNCRMKFRGLEGTKYQPLISGPGATHGGETRHVELNTCSPADVNPPADLQSYGHSL